MSIADESDDGGVLELRLDSTGGTLIGTFTPDLTASWFDFQEQTAAVTGATGIHDLYIVGKNQAGVCNLDYFSFSTDSYTSSASSLSSSSSSAAVSSASSSTGEPGFTLVWSEEFNGSSLDTGTWNIDVGNGSWGWGNGEWQYYDADHVTVSGGTLKLTADCPSGNPQPACEGTTTIYSGKIQSQNKYSFQYGIIKARIKLPYSTGMWPAFWMLGNNISSVGWPACGEVDIMEMSGPDNDTVGCTLHWDEGGHAMYGQEYNNSSWFSDAFHVFEVEWNASQIIGRVDDQQYFVMNIDGANKSEFHQPFYIILNLAVGSGGTGSDTYVVDPDGTTVWPQTMEVDWVRVYQ
ncbi:MAG TPA: family 16 glycosylhydrolase [Spirochaetota bacterium]|nr:family 16 glycosylhydrolase [Spirochaetota bacterium]